MMNKNSLTQERLREILEYVPASGVFIWKVAKAKRIHIGDVAGSVDRNGYVVIGINGYVYLAHRLAWLYVHGVWPDRLIDHRNTVKTDNRIANLRLATQAQNLQNGHAAYKGSASRFRGVSFFDGRPRASIRLNGKATHLGTFDTEEEAHAAYLRAKAELHPFASGEVMTYGLKS